MSVASEDTPTEQERSEVLDFANGKQLDPARIKKLERKGLVFMTPALSIRGCEIAEEGGWKWD